jgi:four helix bundle protein
MNPSPSFVKSKKIALDAIQYCSLLDAQKKYAISNQLIRSATAIGANIRESNSAESLRDFVHKMKIAHKELLESEYWIELCHESAGYPDCSMLQPQVIELKRILNAIISTSMKRLKEK